MKKPIFFLLALGAGFSLATAAPNALDGSMSGFAGPAASRAQPGAQESQDNSSPQAVCRQVEVQLDEGYGVSSQETRLVCEETP